MFKMFRIVAEKRGDTTLGFRVQKRVYSWGNEETGVKEGTVHWINRGLRVSTIAAAERLRNIYVQEHNTVRAALTYEEVFSPPF